MGNVRSSCSDPCGCDNTLGIHFRMKSEVNFQHTEQERLKNG